MNLQEKIEQLIVETGINTLPVERQGVMLQEVYAALNERVGLLFAENMTPEQHAEFGKLLDKNDGSAVDWLKTTFPDYEQIMIEEVDNLKDDIKLLMPEKA